MPRGARDEESLRRLHAARDAATERRRAARALEEATRPLKCPKLEHAEMSRESKVLPLGVVHPFVPRLIQMMSKLEQAPDDLMMRLSHPDATLGQLAQWLRGI